ncbi:MAG TPA: EAL domain-containing protein, partial [Acidimicrobiales bacterium]|nr:EAL domain-containing protein [Acidimicrobiales bacterium]
GMMMVALDRKIMRVNPAMCDLVGLSSDDLVGNTPDVFLHPDDRSRAKATLTERVLGSGEGQYEDERRYLRADGVTVHVRTHVTLVHDANGEPQYLFSQVEDITARKRQEEEIRRLVLEDPLTGLPNRQLLHDRLERALRRGRRSGSATAVVLLDIDHFKRVNDSLGPQTGDLLLMQVARRIADGMRASDTVARVGGDEFVVVSEDVEDLDHALALSGRLSQVFDDPFSVGDEQVYLTVSSGIVFVQDEKSTEAVLRDAATAMHSAKRHGPSSSEVFDESLREQAISRFDLEAALRRALERDEIYVVFQPVVRMVDEAIVGAEALARWDHPDRGMISPAEFIPIAEESGLIAALGERVLDAALEQVARWRRDVPGWESFFVAVNLSPRQLVAEGLLERCLAALSTHGLGPDALRLEVTESTLMDDPELSAKILRGISDAGILIAMDDFGTGFSSLSRLKSLPISTLKIDRSFVNGLGTDASDGRIVNAIVSLGRALNLELCAEGVELPLQRDELIALGCHQAQGYLWAPGMAAENFTSSFANRAVPVRS